MEEVSKMFRDKHDFSAIAVSANELQSAESVLPLLPQASISKPEQVVSVRGDFDVWHLFYYSPERYSRAPELDEVRVTWKGVEQYRYNMYILSIRLRDATALLLGVPFFSMGRVVFGELAKAAHGLGLTFSAIELAKLTDAVQSGKYTGGLIKLSGMEMVVHGDSFLDRVTLTGTDVLGSATFRHLESLAARAATAFSQRRCRIVFDDHVRPRFGLAADRYGNYLFRVTKNAENLPCARELLIFLLRSRLMRATYAFPPSRSVIDESTGI